MARLTSDEDRAIATAAQQLLRAVSPIPAEEAAAAAAERDANALTEAQRASLETGKLWYMATCMACHQLHGRGQDAMAPTLVDSPWVLGSKDRLTRIALQGVQGPLEIEGRTWNLVMPGHAINPALDDEKLAAVLTYVRNEWGNQAAGVDPAEVAAVRAATAQRVEPWTVRELEAIE